MCAHTEPPTLTFPEKVHTTLHRARAVGCYPVESPSFTFPEKLHTIPECARAIGCHPVSLYKAANGQLGMPAPRTIRIGRLVRVRDCDFQEFLAGLSNVKTTVGAAKKKMGRPTRAMQIAARQAAAASSSLVGGAA